MEKLIMGEYSFIVWAAYGVAFAVLGAVAWVSLRDARRARQRLSELSQ